MKNFIIILFLSLTIGNSFAQNNKLFEFDYAQFGYDSVSNYMEIYYSFDQSKLTPVTINNVQHIEGVLYITISDSLTGNVIIDKHWKINHEIPDSISQANRNLTGVIGFKVPDGKLKLYIGGGNNQKESVKYFTEYIKVRPYYAASVSISDIELASNIIQDSQDKNSIFYKNGAEVIPAPTEVFGSARPVVFYYSEIYNLDKVASSHIIKVLHQVFNSKGKLVSNKIKIVPNNLPSKVEMGSVVIHKFPTDIYTLILSVVDSAGNYGVSTAKKFYVVNPDVAPVVDTLSKVNLAALSSQFGVMSEEEIDDLWEKCKYTATSKEIKIYPAKGGVEPKRLFMFEFWKQRDKTSTTTGEDTFSDYLKRVDISNQRFGALGKLGWKTDRGRVFILYGEPSEIERFPNQMDTKPYEIWHYNDLEGGVLFVFADLTGFSEYRLLHSTKRGELQDDSWQQRVSQF